MPLSKPQSRSTPAVTKPTTKPFPRLPTETVFAIITYAIVAIRDSQDFETQEEQYSRYSNIATLSKVFFKHTRKVITELMDEECRVRVRIGQWTQGPRSVTTKFDDICGCGHFRTNYSSRGCGHFRSFRKLCGCGQMRTSVSLNCWRCYNEDLATKKKFEQLAHVASALMLAAARMEVASEEGRLITG